MTVSQIYVRRFGAAALAGLLCLIAITGIRISLLREQSGAVVVATAVAVIQAGPATSLRDQMDAVLAGDPRWQAVVCSDIGGTIRFGGAAKASLSTAPVRIAAGNHRCDGLVHVLDAGGVYPIIRETAVAAIALLVIGALVLLIPSIRGRDSTPQPTKALTPPPGFIPDSVSSAPADPLSETTPRTRHGPH